MGLPNLQRAHYDAVRELAFGAIGVNYGVLGAALTAPARLISLQNTTNVEVYISFDGTTNNLRMVSDSFKLHDLTANKANDPSGLYLPQGTQIWVKWVGAAGTSGAVWAEIVVGA